jgi:hypothetical protein
MIPQELKSWKHCIANEFFALAKHMEGNVN